MLAGSTNTLFIRTVSIVSAPVPVFLTDKSTYAVGLGPQLWSRIFSSSVFMKVKVKAPIHAATAMLTATVTAISMMAATTGLNAFLLLNIFLIFVQSLL